MSPSERDPLIRLGEVSGVYGIKGWVKVYSFTEPRMSILSYRPWFLGEDGRKVEIEDGRPHGKGLIVKLPGVDSPEQARSLIGQSISVNRSQLPEAEDDKYYWADLIGLEVRTTAGERLGRISKMLETGAHDVMVITGDAEHLVPFVVGHFVTNVDLEQGRLEVDWEAPEA